MVYDIVKNHGGDVIARSRPGEGTTFRLLFPTRDRRPREDEEASS
jgi:signal transduction histidine kinase